MQNINLEDKEAMFAVGTQSNCISSLWNITSENDDIVIYSKHKNLCFVFRIKPNAKASLSKITYGSENPEILIRGWRPPGPERTSWENGLTIAVPSLQTTNQYKFENVANFNEIFWCEPAHSGNLTLLSVWRSESAPSGEVIINFHYRATDYALIQNNTEIPIGLLRYLDDSVKYATKSNQDSDFLKIDTGENGEALLYDLRGSRKFLLPNNGEVFRF